jgi:predicted metal-dependent hydrolase
MREAAAHTIVLEMGADPIPVAVCFRPRKCLKLTVFPDGSVTAVAPEEKTLEDVEAHLRKRRKWIARQRGHFAQYPPGPPSRSFVSGETHLYLGRQYRLRVRKAEGTGVKLRGGIFHVETPFPEQPKAVERALDRWYQERARAVFAERMDRIFEEAPSLKPRHPRLHTRFMKRSWGTCSPLGVVTLNIRLLQAPGPCIDYVIVHELCHLEIHEHSPAFYRLLTRHLPDWRERKERLEKSPVWLG